jgi:hypothetical protein
MAKAIDPIPFQFENPGDVTLAMRDHARENARRALAAIPPDLLAQLAIEAGGLEAMTSEWCATHDIAIPPPEWHVGVFGCEVVPLYRRVSALPPSTHVQPSPSQETESDE